MADVHTPAQRSDNMSRIRGINTKPEMLIRKFPHAKGFRHKLHVKHCLVSLILCCLNTKPSSLYTVASGTDPFNKRRLENYNRLRMSVETYIS